jgi:hypothetical protein
MRKRPQDRLHNPITVRLSDRVLLNGENSRAEVQNVRAGSSVGSGRWANGQVPGRSATDLTSQRIDRSRVEQGSDGNRVTNGHSSRGSTRQEGAAATNHIGQELISKRSECALGAWPHAPRHHRSQLTLRVGRGEAGSAQPCSSGLCRLRNARGCRRHSSPTTLGLSSPPSDRRSGRPPRGGRTPWDTARA